MAVLCIIRKEREAVLALSSLIVLWYATSIGREAYYYPWFHIVILVLFVAYYHLYPRTARYTSVHTFVYLFLTSLLAALSDHMAGSTAAIILMDLPADIFRSVYFIYPVERTVLTLSATIPIFLVVLALRNISSESDSIEETVKDAEMDELLDYVKKDVKDVLKTEKKMDE
ncbi:MAG: hypothetical protein U9N13_07605 [Euryarchaeota archaeon]|nr:hypothetical protein [Euryarchaeota archaeon]